MREQGKTVAAYFPGGYVPEEIIHASGAVPISFIYGGDPESAEAAHSAITRFVCPFAKAQIGYRFLGDQPYYETFNLLFAPITCQHLRRVADMYNYYTKVDVFRMGVPFQYNTDHGINYYIEVLKSMARKLEQVTGRSISKDEIAESIKLYNRMRQLFKQIAIMRKNLNFPISSMDFLKLNHASYLADPVFMVEKLESMCEEFQQSNAPLRKGPRILLVGPNLALGDYKIPQLIEEAGGNVVIEHMDEGVRWYWDDVKDLGDVWESLAVSYLQKKLPCVYMVKAHGARLSFLIELAREYEVDGIVWYQLKYCETADIEAFYMAQKLKEADIPMLKLESNYDVSDRGPLKTRIGAFLETLE